MVHYRSDVHRISEIEPHSFTHYLNYYAIPADNIRQLVQDGNTPELVVDDTSDVNDGRYHPGITSMRKQPFLTPLMITTRLWKHYQFLSIIAQIVTTMHQILLDLCEICGIPITSVNTVITHYTTVINILTPTIILAK